MLIFMYNVEIKTMKYGVYMKKKFLFLFIGLNFFMLAYADKENLITDEQLVYDEFADIFAVEDDEQTELSRDDAEELEIEGLQEYGQKPTTPSQATVVMRQLGLKVLIGYIAMRGYMENMWASIKSNLVRFRSWVLREYESEKTETTHDQID